MRCRSGQINTPWFLPLQFPICLPWLAPHFHLLNADCWDVEPPLDVFLLPPFRACKMVCGFIYLFIYIFKAGESLRALPLSLPAGRRREMTALRHLANRPIQWWITTPLRRKHGATDTTLRQPAYTPDNAGALAGGRRTQRCRGASHGGFKRE